MNNRNWTVESNVHVPALLADKKLAGKKTYLDDVILEHLKKGAPPTHCKLPDWSADGGSGLIHGHALKDVFKKAKRLTTTA